MTLLKVDRQRALRRIALPVALVGLWLVGGEPDECAEWVRIFLLAKASGISLLITARRMAGL